MKICPSCNNDVEVSGSFEFVQCAHCNSSLEVKEGGELGLIKESDTIPAQPSPEEAPLTEEEGGWNQNLSESDQEVQEEPIEDEVDASSEEVETEDTFQEEPTDTNFSSDDEPVDSHEDAHSMDESLEPVDLPSYQVNIEDIDSVELKEKVQKILSHPRLALDKTAITSQFDRGTLIVNNINSVKTVFLISHLSHIPVQVTWIQNSKF